MDTKESQGDARFENEHLSKLRTRAIDQAAIGSIILLWGILLTLKQVGIIEKNISTWPVALAAFGILLVAGGIYRFNESKHQ